MRKGGGGGRGLGQGGSILDASKYLNQYKVHYITIKLSDTVKTKQKN